MSVSTSQVLHDMNEEENFSTEDLRQHVGVSEQKSR